MTTFVPCNSTGTGKINLRKLVCAHSGLFDLTFILQLLASYFINFVVIRAEKKITPKADL